MKTGTASNLLYPKGEGESMRRSGKTSQWKDGKTHWALDLAAICLFLNHFVLSHELNVPKELQRLRD